VQRVVLDPAEPLATGTITMPAAPIDGQVVKILSSQGIATLAMHGNSGQALKRRVDHGGRQRLCLMDLPRGERDLVPRGIELQMTEIGKSAATAGSLACAARSRNHRPDDPRILVEDAV
jgi:hypothetical protein